MLTGGRPATIESIVKPGPPKKPTALRIVAGVSRSRLPKNEPTPPPATPAPPARLSSQATREWRRVCPKHAAIGLMSDLDVGALAAYCDAFGDWVVARRELSAIRASTAAGPDAGFTITTTNGKRDPAPPQRRHRC